MRDENIDGVAAARAPRRSLPTVRGDGARVSFAQAIKRGLWKSSVYGRASRSEFWYFWLFCNALNLLSLIVIDGALGLHDVDFWIGALLSFFVFPVFVRRLHDVNRSGWWVLIAFTVIGLIPLFIWSVRRGDRHPNRFDRPRKTSGSAATSIEQVERLHQLRAEGAITDVEFAELKRKVW